MRKEQEMFQNLNDRYYSLFSDLYANRAVLPPKQYEIMAAALNNEYKRELTMVTNNLALSSAREVFEQKFRMANYIPHKFLFFANKIAKAYIKDCVDQFQEFLQDLKYERTVAAEESIEEQPQTAVVPTETEIVLQDD